ncbi:MAG: cupin-like domain-containing protein [Rhodobiaceae bacterium]|nr:cupin-like domain-containing protein [Rhodobiaceae bacterium]
MLDRTTQTILADWKDHYADLFGTHPLCIKHNLHLSPLFSDEALAALLEKADRTDYHVNLMDNGRRREGELGDLSGEDILKAVRNGDIWINLRAPGRADSAYERLVNDIYDEFENRVPGFSTFRRHLTILISSPNVTVKYHIDVPGQTLWQIRGQKRVYVYPAQAPFLSQFGLEKVIINEAHETDIKFQPWFDDYALVKELEPGEMLHWPLNCPHRVDNHDCMNVSITTEHWTPALRNAYAVNYANGMLRKMGFKDLSRPAGGPGMWARLGLAGAVKVSGIQKKDEKPYHVDFRVDPNEPRGVRDIEPYEFRH